MLILASYALADDVMITGHLQGLYGGGLDEDNPTSSEWTASETRLQMRLESYSSSAEFFGRMDFVYDDFAEPEFEANLRAHSRPVGVAENPRTLLPRPGVAGEAAFAPTLSLGRK
jgi:hypothetical protein